MECLARATHACVIHSFSKGEKRGTQCTERLKYQKVSRSENGRSFAKTIFWGKDFAKLRQMFLKFGGDANSPRGGGVWGGIRAGFGFSFLRQCSLYATPKTKQLFC